MMCVCVLIEWAFVNVDCVCGCTDNYNIGVIGAKSIGDGLKSLTSLETLYLKCE